MGGRSLHRHAAGSEAGVSAETRSGFSTPRHGAIVPGGSPASATMPVRVTSQRPSGSTSVATRIATFNDGRDPERLRIKYESMSENAFAFFRATCHLFWADWFRHSRLDGA